MFMGLSYLYANRIDENLFVQRVITVNIMTKKKIQNIYVASF